MSKVEELEKRVEWLELQMRLVHRTLDKIDRKTEPQTYVINPQEPTNDDKCFECDDFFTCGGQCNKIEDEPTISKMEQVEDEPQTDCAWGQTE